MNRRELIPLLGAAMTEPRALCAEQKAMPVIGLLNGTSPGPAAPSVAAFRQGLSEASGRGEAAAPQLGGTDLVRTMVRTASGDGSGFNRFWGGGGEVGQGYG